MFSYASAMAALRSLQRRYAFIACHPIGTTEYGRELTHVRIGCGRRRVLLTAAHHANEWITALVLLAFLEDYAAAFAAGQPLWGIPTRMLYREVTLSVVPLVNPDGVDLVTGAVCPASRQYSRARAIAAAFPQTPFPSGWKANACGVDLNLNYPAGFAQAVQIKRALGFDRPAPCNWPGRTPLDQRETAALAALTEKLSPHCTVALHTQGQEIYWRYGDYADPAAQALGEQMADASGYSLTHPAPGSANAGFKDWFIARFARPGFTVEAGLGQNPLPLTQLPEIYHQVLPILCLAMTGG